MILSLPGVPDLSVRRPEVPEQMDRPDCDLAALHRTYAGFRTVNAVVAGWQLTYRALVRPVLAAAADRAGTGPVSILDIGAGGGDVARALLHRARRDGFSVRVTAVDPDARAHAWATGRATSGASVRATGLASREATGRTSRRPSGRVPGRASGQQPAAGLEILRATSGDLVRAGRRFDVVISNHLLHHLDPGQLDAVLADSEVLATGRAIHSDIRRAPVAYALFSAGALPFFPRSYIRQDGLASIRRSYTPAELATAVRPGWRVQVQVPWRNLAVWDAADRDGVERDVAELHGAELDGTDGDGGGLDAH